MDLQGNMNLNPVTHGIPFSDRRLLTQSRVKMSNSPKVNSNQRVAERSKIREAISDGFSGNTHVA